MAEEKTAGQRTAGKGMAGRLLGGGTWSMLSKACSMPVALAMATLLARLLDPADMGAYFLAMSMVALMAAMVQLGLGRAMIKLVATAMGGGRQGDARRVIRKGLTIVVVSSLALAVALADQLGFWLAGLLEGGSAIEAVMLLVGLVMACFALTEMLTEILRGFHDMRGASILADQLLQRLIFVALLLVAWAAGLGMTLHMSLLLTLATSVVALVYGCLMLWRHVRHLPQDGAPTSTRALLSQSPPFLLMRLNFWLLSGGSIWALGMSRPVEEAAILGAATNLALLVQAPALALNNVLAPIAAQLLGQGKTGELAPLARATSAVLLLLCLPMALVLLIFGSQVLSLVFGPSYAAGGWTIAMLAAGRCVGSIFAPCTMLLAMSERQRGLMVIMTVTSILSFVGFLLVAPVFGAEGIAVVVTVSLAFQSTALLLAARHYLHILVVPQLSVAAVRGLLRKG